MKTATVSPAQRLIDFREQQGLTQLQLASALTTYTNGVVKFSQSALWKLEGQIQLAPAVEHCFALEDYMRDQGIKDPYLVTARAWSDYVTQQKASKLGVAMPKAKRKRKK